MILQDWLGMPRKIAVLAKDSHRWLQGSVSSGAGGIVALWEIRNAAMLMWEIPAQPDESFPAGTPK